MAAMDMISAPPMSARGAAHMMRKPHGASLEMNPDRTPHPTHPMRDVHGRLMPGAGFKPASSPNMPAKAPVKAAQAAKPPLPPAMPPPVSAMPAGAPATATCPTCGAPGMADMSTCPNCGASMNAPPPSGPMSAMLPSATPGMPGANFGPPRGR